MSSSNRSALTISEEIDREGEGERGERENESVEEEGERDIINIMK